MPTGSRTEGALSTPEVSMTVVMAKSTQGVKVGRGGARRVSPSVFILHKLPNVLSSTFRYHELSVSLGLNLPLPPREEVGRRILTLLTFRQLIPFSPTL